MASSNGPSICVLSEKCALKWSDALLAYPRIWTASQHTLSQTRYTQQWNFKSYCDVYL